MCRMTMRRLVVYEREGKVRAEYRAERDDPRPKKGENVIAAADVEILSDPTDSLTDVWDALGLATEDSAQELAKRVLAYGAARKSAGVTRADDFDVEPFDANGTIREKMQLVAAVASVWGKKKAQEQAEAFGFDIAKVEAVQKKIEAAPVRKALPPKQEQG